jgi:hypothetical protein
VLSLLNTLSVLFAATIRSKMKPVNPFDYGTTDIPTVANEGSFALTQDPPERWEETDIAATTENYKTQADERNAATGDHPSQESGCNSLGSERNIQSNPSPVFLLEDYLYFSDDVDVDSRTQSPTHDSIPAQALLEVTEGMISGAPTPKEPQSPTTPQPPDDDDLYDPDEIGQISPMLKPMRVNIEPSPSPPPAVSLPKYKGKIRPSPSPGDAVLISFMAGGKYTYTSPTTRASDESAAVPDEDDIPELDISQPAAQAIAGLDPIRKKAHTPLMSIQQFRELSETGQGESSKAESKRRPFHESPGYMCPFCPDRDHKYPRPENLQR